MIPDPNPLIDNATLATKVSVATDVMEKDTGKKVVAGATIVGVSVVCYTLLSSMTGLGLVFGLGWLGFKLYGDEDDEDLF